MGVPIFNSVLYYLFPFPMHIMGKTNQTELNQTCSESMLCFPKSSRKHLPWEFQACLTLARDEGVQFQTSRYEAVEGIIQLPFMREEELQKSDIFY